MLYLWSFWDLSYSDTVTVWFDDKRNVLEAIIVVKIVVSCAFFPVTRMTRFQPILHVLFFTCAWMYSSVLIHDLVHGLNPANAIYAHTTCYYEKKTTKKRISVFMLLHNISAAKYVWICTQTVFVYILLKCFKTCHTLCRTFAYDSSIT